MNKPLDYGTGGGGTGGDKSALAALLSEPITQLLTRLRCARGLSQLRLAHKLRAISGMPTVTRHEVSQWEGGERIPDSYWLGWLAVALDVPLKRLEAAATSRRGHDDAPTS